MKYAALLLGVVMMGGMALAQTSEEELRQSADVKMAPRSLSLVGGDVDSPSGQYVIEFPSPNNCVQLGPIKATSRSMALYRAVSKGGFTLKRSQGGLTVWTIEEWNQMKAEPWYAQFAEARAKLCGSKMRP